MYWVERTPAGQMDPHIAINRKWSDEDVALLSFEVCDGKSSFINEAYVTLDWGNLTANALKTFAQQIHGGLLNLEAGDEGPEYASGVLRARFHFWRPTALLISTWQQGAFFSFKGNEVASEARMFLRTDPSLLDRFIAALPSVDREGSDEVVLQCVELSAP